MEDFENHVAQLSLLEIIEPLGIWWWRKCPICKGQVNKRLVGENNYYACSSCDYEYAEWDGFD